VKRGVGRPTKLVRPIDPWPEWMRPADVARYLGCSRIQTWRLLRTLKPRRPTGPYGRPFYKRSELDALMEGSAEAAPQLLEARA
jgi:hypothetical protein